MDDRWNGRKGDLRDIVLYCQPVISLTGCIDTPSLKPALDSGTEASPGGRTTHRATQAQQLEQSVAQLLWPAQRPDLNIIENIMC